ncbi:hypothetical protein PR202_ga06593 [Eleusine coracana subsp. coracana]|uniref:Uncharacterized protein n=1 Tax=Eleusine coracana subsp. coracana TaxID=191504 RepID=A0AAV5BWB6_ELECO|nr:hypothetical protein PR202_ga06593 [Eleusine coracana subsp. coracana]
MAGSSCSCTACFGSVCTLLTTSSRPEFKRSCKVYRVNMEKRKLMRARGLRGRAVFIGLYKAISVSPQVFPSLVGNTVYPGLVFGNDQIGTYHLRDESIDYSFNFDSRSGPARPWSLVDCLAAYASG